MQICKRKGLLKNFFVILILSFCSSFTFANSIDLPGLSMPEMPSMPSISLDGSFYKPNVPNITNGVLNNNKSKESNDETIITETKSDEDYLTSFLNNDSTLTASDISNLYNYGLFSNISSLTGIGNITSLNNSTTDLLLQEVLKELNELKNEQKNASAQEQEKLENTKKDSANFKERNPSILRFKINNYDIKDSLLEVFLSKPDEDGSFLLTADRRYVADHKTRNETFYLLFKTVKEAGVSASYDVVPSIDQDYLNINSFIYKMCTVKDLKAEKTGNLVVLKYNDNNLKIDMLIDIDKR